MRVTQYPASASSTSNQPFCSRLAFTPHMCGHPSPCMHPSPPPHEWTLEMYVRTRTRTSRSKGRTYLTSSKSSASRRRPAAARQAAAAICGGEWAAKSRRSDLHWSRPGPGRLAPFNLPLPRSEKYVSLFVPGFLRKLLFVLGGRSSPRPLPNTAAVSPSKMVTKWMRLAAMVLGIVAACGLPIPPTVGSLARLRGGVAKPIQPGLSPGVTAPPVPPALHGGRLDWHVIQSLATCVALIASSAIGGSFLALPMTTRPLGFFP